MKNRNLAIESIEKNDLDAVKRLLSDEMSITEDLGGGQHSIHRSAREGANDVLRFLLTAGADVNAVDERGRTPLQIAAFHGHADTVKTLLKNGALVNTQDLSDGNTPLHDAIREGHGQIVSDLIAGGARLDIRNFGRTPVALAADVGSEAVRAIVFENVKPSSHVCRSVGRNSTHQASIVKRS